MLRLLLTALLLLSVNVFASTPDRLVVGVSPVAPFAMQDSNGNWTGLTIELWEDIAEEMGVEYQYIQLPLAENIQSVHTKTTDVALGAISITESREQLVDFTHTYFTSGLGIITKQTRSFSVFDILTDERFLKSVAQLIGFVFAGGLLILICENGAKNPDFKITNVGNGVWWSIVTITTTGYGDLVPKTTLGRIFASIWMVLGAIIVPAMIGGLAATMTLDTNSTTIKSKSSLHRHAVGIIGNTSTELYFKNNNIPYTAVNSLDELLSKVNDGSLDGGVYDAPMLQYHARKYPDLVVLPEVFDRQYYGFAIQEGSPLRNQLNVQLLRKTNDQKWLHRLNVYLGD